MRPARNRLQRNTLLTYIADYVQECDTDTLQSGTRNGSAYYFMHIVYEKRDSSVNTVTGYGWTSGV
jgi:hypothetical protein